MNNVHKIKKGTSELNGSVDDPGEIVTAKIKYELNKLGGKI